MVFAVNVIPFNVEDLNNVKSTSKSVAGISFDGRLTIAHKSRLRLILNLLPWMSMRLSSVKASTSTIKSPSELILMVCLSTATSNFLVSIFFLIPSPKLVGVTTLILAILIPLLHKLMVFL